MTKIIKITFVEAYKEKGLKAKNELENRCDICEKSLPDMRRSRDSKENSLLFL